MDEDGTGTISISDFKKLLGRDYKVYTRSSVLLGAYQQHSLVVSTACRLTAAHIATVRPVFAQIVQPLVFPLQHCESHHQCLHRHH
jgi:hypothetical protein